MKGAYPFVYANNLIVVRSSADMAIILQYAGTTVGVVSLSYTLAKTLMEKMGTLIAELEERTGRIVMTTSFIDTALASPTEEEADAVPE